MGFDLSKLHAKGKRTDTMREMNPRVAACFALYLDCRTLNFVHLEVSKDRGKKVEHKVLPFAVGYGNLPEPGGMLDQPHWTMAMFNIFRSGENAGVRETM